MLYPVSIANLAKIQYLVNCTSLFCSFNDPKSGSSLQARRQFAPRFATVAGGIKPAAGVRAGSVAGRAGIFAVPRSRCDTSAARHPTALLLRATRQRSGRCEDRPAVRSAARHACCSPTVSSGRRAVFCGQSPAAITGGC